MPIIPRTRRAKSFGRGEDFEIQITRGRGGGKHTLNRAAREESRPFDPEILITPIPPLYTQRRGFKKKSACEIPRGRLERERERETGPN